MAYSNLDDVDYLVEDNVMDDFCLSPEMEGTLVVQAGNKMQMLGMILVTGAELNSRECLQCFNGYRIIEETKSTRIPKEQLL